MKILTFDIEDWFHILDHRHTKSEKNWSNYESRIDYGVEIILDIIEKANVSATFFVLGWVAKQYPNIVKKINNRGFEIGTHSHMHQLVYEMSREEFFNDVEKSIKTIEDCIGLKVNSFRAPGFSITEKNKWAFETLHELGIKCDCSVFPAGRAHGGMPKYKHAKPSILKYNGIVLKEFPINTYNLLGIPVIYSGGGYFRLFPYTLIKKFSKNADHVMTYFHPRDFDIGQPVVPGLSKFRTFKSYVGIKNARFKLEKWLKEYDFHDLKKANKLIQWNDIEVINI